MKKQIIIVLAISALGLASCEDDPIEIKVGNPTSDGAQLPIAITSFYPESGDCETIVYLFGENFGGSISENSVMFNGMYSEVLQVRPGKITVRVPMNLADGDYEISLTSLDQTVTSPKTFFVKGN